jgi:hypothetical protein
MVSNADFELISNPLKKLKKIPYEKSYQQKRDKYALFSLPHFKFFCLITFLCESLHREKEGWRCLVSEEI